LKINQLKVWHILIGTNTNKIMQMNKFSILNVDDDDSNDIMLNDHSDIITNIINITNNSFANNSSITNISDTVGVPDMFCVATHTKEINSSEQEKKYKVSKPVGVNLSVNTLKKKPHKNVRRMLCQNVIKDGSCSYGNKCMYAHTLDEQNIDPPRKQVWNILLSTNSLESIDLQKNYQLYQCLEQLTKLCKQCDKNECIGGYNCDHGVFSEKYQVCQRDLDYGDCKDDTCRLVHLTSRGMKPWFNRTVKTTPFAALSSITSLSALQLQIMPKIKGTLLNKNFFNNDDIENKDEETLSNFTDSSSEDGNIENECDKSIFER
jgi:hypothetical protein